MERAIANARSASAARTMASMGTEVPAIARLPHDVQTPASDDPTKVAVEHDGQVQG